MGVILEQSKLLIKTDLSKIYTFTLLLVGNNHEFKYISLCKKIKETKICKYLHFLNDPNSY